MHEAERDTPINEIQNLVTLQEAAIAQHPPATQRVYEKARDSFLAGHEKSPDKAWRGVLTGQEALLVSRYMLTSSFISAWYHLSGDTPRRDKAAHSCCTLVETAARLSSEVVMGRYLSLEELWRTTLKREGISRASLFTWSSVGLVVPLAAFWWSISRGADLRSALGYSIAQLGYVLLASGIIAGSFKILGIRTRGRTLMLGVVVWIAGTVLVNA